MIGQDRLKKHREAINRSFKKWLDRKDSRFNHIDKLPNRGILIDIFTYEVPTVTKNLEPMVPEIQESWYHRFMFPIARVLVSDNKEIPAGSFVGIPVVTTMLVENPMKEEAKKAEKQEPRPDIPEFPDFIRLIDVSEDWKNRQFYDLFVKREKTDSLYVMMDYSIQTVYGKKVPDNLNNFIDGNF